MQHKKTEYFGEIEKFINSYKDMSGGSSPSVREIADGCGLSPATISRYMAYMKQTGQLNYDGHRNITTKQTENDLSGTTRVPVLGRISCGIPKFAEENIEEYVKLPASLFGRGEFFILAASGDSMTGAGIDDGDYVLVRQQDTAEYNQIVVALVDDEATLKRFRPENGCICLHPENEKFDDIVVDSCAIQGVAVKILKNLC